MPKGGHGFSLEELREVNPAKLEGILTEAIQAGDIFQVYIKDNYPKILFLNWHPQYKAIDPGIHLQLRHFFNVLRNRF